MFHIVLYQPEIPPNTGNIIRLCANSGCHLHLIEPLGFSLDDKMLRRAGLDYHEYASVTAYPDLTSCQQQLNTDRWFACSSKVSTHYTDPTYHAGDVFLFGPETRGLPVEVLAQFDNTQQITIPMLPDSRSLNLSNSVAVITYEAWRQIDFRR